MACMTGLCNRIIVVVVGDGRLRLRGNNDNVTIAHCRSGLMCVWQALDMHHRLPEHKGLDVKTGRERISKGAGAGAVSRSVSRNALALNAVARISITKKNFVTSFWRAVHKCHDMLAGLVVVSAAATLLSLL